MPSSTQSLFTHHVFFWLKNPGDESDKGQLISGLETLLSIPGIRLAQIGAPADTNRDVIDRSYDVSWLLLFDNADDEAVYQEHPVHQQFVQAFSHLWDKVAVYDSVGPKRVERV